MRPLRKIPYEYYYLPAAVFIFVFSLLAFIQVKLTSNPLILLERFIKGGGCFEIAVVSFYGAFVTYRMQQPENVIRWRRITWTLFSVIFFSQLILGLLGAEKFLMTGKLHLPIPFMILSGPLYRGQLSVMTLLFISTVLLTGPAWCSQLCYFGAFDNLASIGRTSSKVLSKKTAIKTTLLILIITATLLFRWLGFDILYATLAAIVFGLAGISIMIFISRKKGKMVHCALYCPIGTLVNIIRPINPFRMIIDKSCTLCMKCSGYCKYDALAPADIHKGKPGYGCTYCGDCLSACRSGSIKYQFFKLDPDSARRLYLFLTISLHAVFLALARI